jgi:hypothetical protein
VPAVTEGNVADVKAEHEPALVERWLQEQQEWQRTLLSYLDSMMKKDDFLVHLGNAMRGSLLAGKPYPSATPAPGAVPETPSSAQFDTILFTLHQIQGQLQDLGMTVDQLRRERTGPATTATTSRSATAAKTSRPKTRTAPARSRKRKRR